MPEPVIPKSTQIIIFFGTVLAISTLYRVVVRSRAVWSLFLIIVVVLIRHHVSGLRYKGGTKKAI